MLYIGQMVVCVDDKFPYKFFYRVPDRERYTLNFPVRGKIYRIRRFIGRGRGILLHEVSNPISYLFNPEDGKSYEGEPSFYAWRFRPLEEKKKSTETGMTILKEILERETNQDKQPEKAK